MQNLKKKIVVKIIIRDGHGKVLFLVRSSIHPLYSGQLDLPGGLVERFESPLDAIKRESEEETSLVLHNKMHVLAKKRIITSKENIYYYIFGIQLASLANFNVQLSNEHSSFILLDVNDLDSNLEQRLTDDYIIDAINLLRGIRDGSKMYQCRHEKQLIFFKTSSSFAI